MKDNKITLPVRYIVAVGLTLVALESHAVELKEYWYKSEPKGTWTEPSYIAITLVHDREKVCGVLSSSLMGTNRIDRSLLVGRVLPGNKYKVMYASSYYAEQQEVAIATLELNGTKLRWSPGEKVLRMSWFWDETLLNRVKKPYDYGLSPELVARCQKLNDMPVITAKNLYLDP
ncbi:hypothetical protein [Sulfurimonas sp. HSL-1716]|uniref:hypothetical protein n=1 Tax=Hydrocurvibacter sulfurireducens TaxID=3131937 RepID=UPI0031F92A73